MNYQVTYSGQTTQNSQIDVESYRLGITNSYIKKCILKKFYQLKKNICEKMYEKVCKLCL